MPNGETAVATKAVNRGGASRIGYQIGQVGSSRRAHAGDSSFVGGTNVRTVRGKPKGYSTGRSQAAAKSYMRERGMPVPSDRQVKRTHDNFMKPPKKSRKKGKAKAKAKKAS